MLSRVAAVMAPRTHNRRRVTGSRGRRREGRESEPQRPHMSRRVFTSAVLLLVVMMCCCTGEAAASEKPNSGKGSSRKTHFVWRDTTGDEKLSLFRVPVLVEMDGEVFAVAEAQCTKDENSFTGIASELLKLTDEKSKGELDTTKLKTQVLEECPSQNKVCASQAGDPETSQGRTKVRVSRPTTVVNGSRIYMFAGNYSFKVTEGADQTAAAAQWGLLVAVGNVSNDESSNKRIYWKDASVIPWTDFETQHESLTGLIGGCGSGIQMKDGTLVLPVEGTKKNGKAVSLIIRSSDAAGGNLSKGMSADGCSDHSVVEWKDKLMMMTACDDGRRRVYESDDKGDSWTEALGTLSRVWGNKHEGNVKVVGSGFSTATIEDNRDVMLVTLPVYSKKEEKGVLHLWLTDNTHIADIGPVSGDDDVAASSLLYKSGTSGKSETDGKEELIVLYEKKNGDAEKPSPGMVSMRLAEQLKRVKEVLATWKKVDNRISKLCPTSSATVIKSTGTACSTDKITAGLVGFLSGSFSDDTWRDEYLGVNATVTKGTNGVATESSDGVRFTGRGEWAEWPVGSQGENQLYHFANYNFTLVATVSIHGEPKSGSVPLMGVRAGSDGVTKLMELSYDSGKKWQALCCDGTTKRLKGTWDPQRQYQVAIVLQNGTQGSVYVDGQRVCESVQSNFENTESKGISHFYIGGDGDSAENTVGDEDVSVTVTNVLLYNRPLTFTGGIADLEEDIASASETPVKQAASQQSRKKRETQQVPAASSSHAVGKTTGDGGIVRGSGLLPSLLLLLGLWGFAAL
ncbi:trans-sialidase [Trypanosoma cruzi Dm28c]|uniref:Trans-sialidase n=2 Tax=Trypanosoma cruzi TaxID=5693 RepID=V5BA26_TRYCR|nr:trans-sialidase [Trypanosoma cruzi Dm28c]PBJ77718.1 trans-sialidase [Trypanosoma cruzi cruzi]PWU92236.1 putative trans-sialidase, Group V [Trypanosoma cruzi]